MPYRLLIKGGRLIDKYRDSIGDVVILGDRIEAVNIACSSGGSDDSTARKVGAISEQFTEFNATGCLVIPGMIDLHCHVDHNQTALGVHPDETCLARGVTTVVDAGSAGSHNIDHFFENIIKTSLSDVYAFLHVSKEGLTKTGCVGAKGAGGELNTLSNIDEEAILLCCQKFKDVIKGIKIRLAADVTNEGRNEEQAFRKAIDISASLLDQFGDGQNLSQKSSKKLCDRLNLPLMVHHALSFIPIGPDDAQNSVLTCPGSLRKGDIYTHCYHGYEPNILDNKSLTKIHPAVIEAKARGVTLCLGHGQGSFSWQVARTAAANGVWPDIISSDLHTDCVEGPTFDLCLCMTKMLHLGMPLNDIIHSVTCNPATTLSMADRGTLEAGTKADVTVLRLVDQQISVFDFEGQMETAERYFEPVAVFKSGLKIDVLPKSYSMNEEKIEKLESTVEQNTKRFEDLKSHNKPHYRKPRSTD